VLTIAEQEKISLSRVVRFQDPSFTKADREFLRKRGHIELDCDPTISKRPMDPRLSGLVSSSALCCLPCLDIDVAVEVICAAKSSLYLGNDLVGPTASALLVSQRRILYRPQPILLIVLASPRKNPISLGCQ
jgi:hypothetical protein